MEIGSVLFAAGRGTRLRPLTNSVPKPALPVLDLPLGAWGLAALTQVAPPVVVNASHLADRLIRALDALGLEGWEAFVEEPEAFGTAGTLAALRPRIGRRVVTHNADLVSDLDVHELLAAHERGNRAATLAVAEVPSGADLKIDSGVATVFVDRRERREEVGARFIGAAVFERAALDLLPEERPAGLGETLLPELVARGEVTVHVHPGYWRDVGTLNAYEAVIRDVGDGRAPRPRL